MPTDLDGQLNIRLPAEMKRRLEQVAEDNGLRASDIARIAVERLLQQKQIRLLIAEAEVAA